VDWIYLAQNREEWRTVLNRGNFFRSLETDNPYEICCFGCGHSILAVWLSDLLQLTIQNVYWCSCGSRDTDSDIYGCCNVPNVHVAYSTFVYQLSISCSSEIALEIKSSNKWPQAVNICLACVVTASQIRVSAMLFLLVVGNWNVWCFGGL
jgi:hypothetical protein